MSLYEPMTDEDKQFFSGKMLACPRKGHFISFQLVDEFGDICITAVNEAGKIVIEKTQRIDFVVRIDFRHDRLSGTMGQECPGQFERKWFLIDVFLQFFIIDF